MAYHRNAQEQRGPRAPLYEEITARIIAELEAGRLPWVQALGPLLVGFILAKRAGLDAQPADYAPAIQMGLVCLALCSLLFITVIRANDRQSRGASDAQRAAAGALS